MVRAANNNLSTVAHQTGISRALVKLWADKYGPTLWNAQPIVIPEPKKLAEAEIIKTREDESIEIRRVSRNVCDLVVKELEYRIQFGDPKVPTSVLIQIFKEIAPYSLAKVLPDNSLKTETTTASLDEFILNFENKLKEHNVTGRKIRITRTTKE